MVLHDLINSNQLEALRQYFKTSPEKARSQINAPNEDGFTPLMLAVCAEPSNDDLIQLLIDHGADTRHRHVLALCLGRYAGQMIHDHNATYYDDAPSRPEIVGLAYQLRFDEIARRLRAGESDAPLGWTPLLRAVAIGTLADIEAILDQSPNVAAVDNCDHNAWLLAIATGDIAKAELLRQRGAVPAKPPLNSYAPLSLAAMRGDIAMATWLIKQGESVNSVDAAFAFSATPLIHAARENKLGMVQLLLAAGADPNFVPPGHYATPLQSANSRDVALALFSAGADMRSANVETHRLLIGLTENPHDSTLNLNEAEFRAGMSPRFGESNPHELTAPYVIRMIQTGKSGYLALQEYKSLPNVEPTKFHSPIWSAARFGQSLTFLPDGRMIQIAGEHEDYYDPDFCIYNDVFVHHPDGRIQVFGYPREVFPPTDFHSATSIGVYLYVLGNLGYANAPIPKRTPVYRLNTTTYQMEAIDTTGESPHRLYKHSAKLLANGIIRVSGGSCDERVYDFDTKTHHWSLVAGHIETDPLKIRLDSAEMNERVRQANERVNAYWDGREPGGENEANDPQHMLALEFFALYEAQHRLGGDYHTAAETAFGMWSNLDGGSAQIDNYLPKIIPGDQIPRIIRNRVRAAYERDGRMDDYAACFDRLLGMLDKKDFKLYMLADELAQSMSAEDNVRARTVCAQILSIESDGYQAQQAREALRQMDTLIVGLPAPDFTRTDVNGNPITLSALRGKVVLIDFWATWCGPCIAEMPHLKRVAQTFADKPFTLLSISLDRDPEAAKHIIRQNDMTWTHILESGWDGSELSTLYGVLGIPQLYLIDALGRIRARGLRGHAIDEAVAALLDEI